MTFGFGFGFRLRPLIWSPWHVRKASHKIAKTTAGQASLSQIQSRGFGKGHKLIHYPNSCHAWSSNCQCQAASIKSRSSSLVSVKIKKIWRQQSSWIQIYCKDFQVNTFERLCNTRRQQTYQVNFHCSSEHAHIIENYGFYLVSLLPPSIPKVPHFLYC